MKRKYYLLFPIIISFLFAQSINLPKYKIVNEDIYDAPIKTQVEQHLFVSGEINEDNLERLLLKQFKLIMGRNNFKYHRTPTNVYIYAYSTREKAETEQGLWLAMLEVNKTNINNPRITVKENLISKIGVPAEEKYGLSENKRKIIYKEIIQVERKAMDVAESREPNDFFKQADLSDNLMNKYKNELANKYKITRVQLGEIGLEGVVNQWPRP